MKLWICAFAMAAAFAVGECADAKAKGATQSGGIHGRVASISSDGFFITVGGRNNRHNIHILVGSNTTIQTEGGGSAKIDEHLIGKHVSITGTAGKVAGSQTIDATSVTVGSHPHKHPKKPTSPPTTSPSA